MIAKDLENLSTVCYLHYNDQWLMLYRNKKENDVNEGKYLGIGGHFQDGEMPHTCAIREIYEETGIRLAEEDIQLRGTLTFVHNDAPALYIFVFTAELSEQPPLPDDCREGELTWVRPEEFASLPLWEGDRTFLSHLLADGEMFHMSLAYKGDTLISQHWIGPKRSY